jgi:hypothetical protein
MWTQIFPESRSLLQTLLWQPLLLFRHRQTLGDRPAVAVLIAPVWAARVDEQNHRLAAGEMKHEDTRATFH